jgi:hypothetical protein
MQLRAMQYLLAEQGFSLSVEVAEGIPPRAVRMREPRDVREWRLVIGALLPKNANGIAVWENGLLAKKPPALRRLFSKRRRKCSSLRRKCFPR